MICLRLVVWLNRSNSRAARNRWLARQCEDIARQARGGGQCLAATWIDRRWIGDVHQLQFERARCCAFEWPLRRRALNTISTHFGRPPMPLVQHGSTASRWR